MAEEGFQTEEERLQAQVCQHCAASVFIVKHPSFVTIEERVSDIFVLCYVMLLIRKAGMSEDSTLDDEENLEGEEATGENESAAPQTDTDSDEGFHSMAEIASCSYAARQVCLYFYTECTQ